MDEIKSMIHWKANLMESPDSDYHKVFIEATIPEFEMRGSMTLLVRDSIGGMETLEKVLLGFEQQYVESTLRQLTKLEKGEVN